MPDENAVPNYNFTAPVVQPKNEAELIKDYQIAFARHVQLFGAGLLSGRIMCNKHTWITGVNIMFACKHVAKQDEVHPVGIIRMPEPWFLCKDCFFLHERQKLDIDHEVMTVCKYCVFEEIKRIQAINPGLFADLTVNPFANVSRSV